MHDEDERDGSRAQRERDRQDFSNEIAGNETGRMRRFVPEDRSPAADKDRREGRARDLWTTTLALRLQQFSQRLDDLERASLRALQQAERAAETTAQRIDALRWQATRDSNGRLVYRSADGRAGFYEDGRQLSQEAFDAIRWQEGAPTWEERSQAEEEHRRQVRAVDEIGAYRDRLHTARERLESGAPLTEAELEDLEQSLAGAPAAITRELARARHDSAPASDPALDVTLSASEAAALDAADMPSAETGVPIIRPRR